MGNKKRILLTYITLNSGHHRASLAVENALRELSDNLDILNINAFGYTNPVLEKFINKTYMSVIKNKPEVWEYLYDNPKVLRNVQGMRDLIHRLNSKKLKVLLEDFKPDVVACTQAFPCGMMADYKKNLNLGLPLIGILTDHAPHSYWIFRNVDYYVVPSENCKQRFIKNGVSESKIKPFGIPIAPRFKEGHDKEKIRSSLGLEKEKKTVLIMGGSQGLGPVEHMVYGLEGLEIDFQIIVICGTNKKLKDVLNKRKERFSKNTVILGYTDNINELMEISDIVITKPGGLTTSEALVKELPMMIVHPIPGQETKNTEFLLEEGVAVKAQDIRDVAVLVRELFLNPTKLSVMKQQASLMKKPDSARDTAELILSI